MDYRINEGSIVVPEDWRDESMNIFRAPESEGYNLVVTREKIPKSVEPEEHLAERRKMIEENLTGFRERGRGDIVLDGRPCTWLEYMWKSPQGSMSQLNLMRVVGDTLVSFTFTSAREFTGSQRLLFQRVLESYRGVA